MTQFDRRSFLKKGSAGAAGFSAGLTVLANSKSAKAYAENEKVSAALIGAGYRGIGLGHSFCANPECDITHVCDLREDAAKHYASQFSQRQGKEVAVTKDFREVLDDKSIDAVLVVTPDHWHCAMSAYACLAGKDVYVEKPLSYDPWEGENLSNLVKKTGRVLQVGTQNRSAPYNFAAKKFIEDGNLGTIRMCNVINMKPGFSLHRANDPENKPADFDWDTWQGPAPLRPYDSKVVRSGWHELYDYSQGDMANDGIHQLDLARWLCGGVTPVQASALGGKFHTDNDGEVPDTLKATYKFGNDFVMTFSLTKEMWFMLKNDGAVRNGDIIPYWPQNATRIEIYGDKGVMYVARHGGGWEFYVRPNDRKPVCKKQVYGRFPDAPHIQNFIDCIKTRETPNASVVEGHKSSMLIHYAMMSHRLGGVTLNLDTETGHLVDAPEGADKLYRRVARAPFDVLNTEY